MVLLALLVILVPGISENVCGTGTPGDSGDGGPASMARLDQPFDVAFDAKGNLFLSDTGNHRIRRVDARTGTITTVAGSGKKGFGGDGGPRHGRSPRRALRPCPRRTRQPVLRRPAQSPRVRKVDAADRPHHDGRGGRVECVLGRWRPGGRRRGSSSRTAWRSTDRGGCSSPMSPTIASASSTCAHGTIATFAGDGRGRHAGDGGPAASASIHGARAVEVGPDGTVWILERQGNTLRAVDPKTGVITTRAGTSRAGYSGDGGPAAECRFNGPKELCLDRAGNIFVVDTENHAIRRIEASSGRITTVAGDGRRPVPGEDDPATTDRLDRPHGVAVAADGSIVIGDTGNHRIRRVVSRLP